MLRIRRVACLGIAAVVPMLANSAIAGVSNWAGSMSVYNNASGSQGSFVFSSPWGVSDLKTTVLTSNPTIIGDRLTLQPNYNAYADALGGTDADRAFWTNSTDGGVTAGAAGNKWMVANTYFEDPNAIAVSSYSLSGTVDLNNLDAGYTAEAFITVIDPSFFITVLDVRVTLPITGLFTVTADLSAFQGMRLQTGFTISGLNANPANEGALGGVTVTITSPAAVPASAPGALALVGIAGIARSRRRR